MDPASRQTTPVAAGVGERTRAGLSLTYAESYLARSEALPTFEPELPLGNGIIDGRPARHVISLEIMRPSGTGVR